MKIIDEGTAEIVMHPVRFKILQFIKNSNEPPFIEQIANAVNEHPRLVSHHIDVLQDIGLIECKYEFVKVKGSTREVAVRRCYPTSKVSQVFDEIIKAAMLVK